jgi:hypothetical protein
VRARGVLADDNHAVSDNLNRFRQACDFSYQLILARSTSPSTLPWLNFCRSFLTTHGVELRSSLGDDPVARQKICMDFTQGVF